MRFDRIPQVCALAFCLGCGLGRDVGLAPVKGEISYQGTPLKDGTVSFVPAEEPRDSFGGLIRDGQYVIGNSEVGYGVPPGKYRVGVVAWKIWPDSDDSSPNGVRAVPEKYADTSTSGLMVDVPQKGGKFDFHLKE